MSVFSNNSPDVLEVNKSLTGSAWPFLRCVGYLLACRVAAEPSSSEPVRLDFDARVGPGGLDRRGALSIRFSPHEAQFLQRVNL